MIMLHELLFSIGNKRGCFETFCLTFIRNKHFETGLVLHSSCEEESSSVDFKNKKPSWSIREIPEDGNNVHVSCQYSKKG